MQMIPMRLLPIQSDVKHLVALAMEKHVLKKGLSGLTFISQTELKSVTGSEPIKEPQFKITDQSFHLFMRLLNCLSPQL